jgi:hypothetical protein
VTCFLRPALLGKLSETPGLGANNFADANNPEVVPNLFGLVHGEKGGPGTRGEGPVIGVLGLLYDYCYYFLIEHSVF